MRTFNKKWLEEKYSDFNTIPFIFFWSHRPLKEGIIDKSCFSQWYPSPFTFDEVVYPTAEHWMMAQKAKLFKDMEAFENIMSTHDPKKVKNEGRKIKKFDPIVWNERKFEIVLDGNLHKFNQNKSLQKFLINTGEHVLVEASPVDRIWGIGLSVNEQSSRNPDLWNGENLLGFVLMEVREKLGIYEKKKEGYSKFFDME